MHKYFFIVLIMLFAVCPVFAQEDKKKGMPPAIVVVSDVRTGIVSPESEFIGTVYYQEVSDVASELNGRVDSVRFEEGQSMNKGDVLVRLDSEILKKKLQATVASHEQVLSDLEQANREFSRAEKLFKEELVSEQRYDETKFRVLSLEKRTVSLKAEVDLLEIELGKASVRVPFEGVVIRKHVDRGEWVSEGESVATIAKIDIVDIIVEVPENILQVISVGLDVDVKAGGKVTKGKVVALIPQGDTATRTFPVKIRISNNQSLAEGMEAQVRLPIGRKKKTLVMTRDAVVPVFGVNAVFVVIDGKAKMIPVQVVGYSGMTVGVSGQGLEEGMKVVVKGNERLRDGQDVQIKE
jgi:RND family efflux transporter MFP subunit